MKWTLAESEAMAARSRADYEGRREIAAWLIGRLREEMPPRVLDMVGRALWMLDGPLGLFGGAFYNAANGPVWLAELKASSAMFTAIHKPELLERWEDADGPPWSLVAEAMRRFAAMRRVADGEAGG